MKKIPLPILITIAFIFGLLSGLFIPGLFSLQDSTEKACDEKCQLQANQEKCSELIPKLDEYLKIQANLNITEYEINRLEFQKFAKYLDTFYFETYAEVNLNQVEIRDALYQASDRSSELYQESSTTKDENRIGEIQNMLQQEIQNIIFYSNELKKSCSNIDVK